LFFALILNRSEDLFLRNTYVANGLMSDMREELIEIIHGLKGRLELLRYSGITDVLSIKEDFCSACARHVSGALMGQGRADADLFFVLGCLQNGQMEHFQGEAGVQLQKIIQWMAGVSKNARFKSAGDAYVSYAVKCPEAAACVDEAAIACKPLLEKELNAVNPKVVVALGKTAALALIGSSDVKGLRGRVHALPGARLIVTHSLEEILKNPELKKEAWADMELALMEISKADV